MPLFRVYLPFPAIFFVYWVIVPLLYKSRCMGLQNVFMGICVYLPFPAIFFCLWGIVPLLHKNRCMGLQNVFTGGILIDLTFDQILAKFGMGKASVHCSIKPVYTQPVGKASLHCSIKPVYTPVGKKEPHCLYSLVVYSLYRVYGEEE